MDERAITALYEEWARAVVERDAAALDRLFDPSYAYTSPLGERLDRQQIIELEMRLPPPDLPFLDFGVQPLTDDVLIVRGRHLLKGEFPEDVVGADLVERIRAGIEIAFTSVWRRTDGHWRVASNDAHIVSDG
jgi:ketosteroid isomerase-like protein